MTNIFNRLMRMDFMLKLYCRIVDFTQEIETIATQ